MEIITFALKIFFALIATIILATALIESVRRPSILSYKKAKSLLHDFTFEPVQAIGANISNPDNEIESEFISGYRIVHKDGRYLYFYIQGKLEIDDKIEQIMQFERNYYLEPAKLVKEKDGTEWTFGTAKPIKSKRNNINLEIN